MNFFSIHRCRAVIAKEFIQMKRDRATLAMMIGIPVIQLILFGFAINTDPKHLPTAVIAADLALSTDTRERSAALRALEEMRQEWLAAH